MKTCPSCNASYPPNYTHCPLDGAALAEGGAWQDGALVRGKYRIICKLGQGGMAVVYKAMHARFKELRALKVMNPELASNEEFVKRFLHEAVLTRKIQHCNAVRVDDIDESEDGRPFIVMEYIEGRSLRNVIETEAPMSAARVCSIIRQVAGALDAAHGLGIVHRDVKPANIVLAADSSASTQEGERPKVLDFGIAKAKEAGIGDNTQLHTSMTATGSVIGTPAYMSPEQARGMKGDQLDARSDLYSLGMVMYQMLAGGMPFEADTSMEWILAHVQTPPKPLLEARPDLQIPPPLAEVVMCCLEKDRERRPASAAALIQEIEAAQRATPLPFPAEATSSFWKSGSQPPGGPTVRMTLPSYAASGPVPTGPGYGSSASPANSKPTRRWLGWVTATLCGLVICIAVVLWVTKPWLARPNRAAGAAQPDDMKSGPARTGAPPQSSEVPASPPSSPAVTPSVTDAKPSPQPGGPVAESSASPQAPPNAVDTRASAATKDSVTNQASAAAAKRNTDALVRERQIGAAMARAKEAEDQGKFEDALKEYEQASKLDPSNQDVRRDIRRLRDQIAKENEVYH